MKIILFMQFYLNNDPKISSVINFIYDVIFMEQYRRYTFEDTKGTIVPFQIFRYYPQ